MFTMEYLAVSGDRLDRHASGFRVLLRSVGKRPGMLLTRKSCRLGPCLYRKGHSEQNRANGRAGALWWFKIHLQIL